MIEGKMASPDFARFHTLNTTHMLSTRILLLDAPSTRARFAEVGVDDQVSEAVGLMRHAQLLLTHAYNHWPDENGEIQ